MGEIRIVSPGKTRGYPLISCMQEICILTPLQGLSRLFTWMKAMWNFLDLQLVTSFLRPVTCLFYQMLNTSFIKLDRLDLKS